MGGGLDAATVAMLGALLQGAPSNYGAAPPPTAAQGGQPQPQPLDLSMGQTLTGPWLGQGSIGNRGMGNPPWVQGGGSMLTASPYGGQ